MLNKQNIKDIYPLAPMQEGMLFHHLLEPLSKAYFEQSTYTLRGNVAIDILEKSIQYLIERHDILRTVFAFKNVSRPFQVVLKQVEFKLQITDISDKSEAEQEVAFEQLKQADFNSPFKLGEDILLRVSLVKCSETTMRIIWSHHHILMDGWCMGVIVSEFLEIYKSLKNGNEPVLSTVVPFAQYIKWLENKDKNTSKNYWKKYLASSTERVSLPSPKNNVSSYSKNNIKFQLEHNLSEGILNLTKQHGLTSNIIFQTAWGILLQKYNYTNSSVFGAVIAGRPSEIQRVESILGLFINTIPVKIEAGKDTSFLQLAKNVQMEASERMAHEYLSLADISDQSAVKKDVFDHILVYENFPTMALDQIDEKEYGFKISDVNTFEQTNYDLNVIFFPKGNDIFVKYDFNEDRYTTHFITSVQQAYASILNQICANPEKEISTISLIPEEKTVVEFDKPKQTIVDLFIQKANEFPDAIAVEFGNVSLSFSQLHEQSNQFAKILKEEYHINKGDFIGLLADRSEKLITSILAILKLGACYIPIDSSNPKERIEYMLSDSHAKLLITDQTSVYGIQKIDINDIDTVSLSKETINEAELTDLAYIIYTSGSSGLPKGCKLTHSNLSHYIEYANAHYFEENSIGNTALFTSLSFDLTITSIFTPLTRGAKLSILPQEDDIKDLLKAAFDSKLNLDFVKITPAHAALLPHIDLSKTSISSIVIGGEELKREHLFNLFALNSKLNVYNEYGPTETTVGCCVKRLTSQYDEITIGTPIANTALIVVDESLNELPDGALGELCIAGNGVGEGYLNRAELTKERFVAKNGCIWYRTGDLATKLPEGEWQFLGRIDSQTKVRGYRIEAGEIEYQLLQTGFAKQVFVTVISETLCAYVVSENNIDKHVVSPLLAKVLPSYMLPDVYVNVDSIPLTINGKVDVTALPNPLDNPLVEFIAPTTETEIQLAELWKQVLGVEKIGLNDNFFNLGGHSLKTTILSSLIAKNFQKEIKLKQIFENPTLLSQAILIEKDETNSAIALEKALQQDFYELSYSQKQIWVVQQIDSESVAYIIPASRKLIGELNTKALEQAFQTLFERHDILRSNFISKEGEPKMVIKPFHKFTLEIIDICNSSDKTQLLSEYDSANTTAPFYLENDALLRVKLVRLSENEHVLFFAMHHIVSDGWSMEIIISEIGQLYNAYLKQDSNPLSPLKFQYKDYLLWENKMLSGERFEQQKQFWNKHFTGGVRSINLPYDNPKIKTSFNGDSIVFYFSKEQKEQLKLNAIKQGVTLNVFILAVFNVFLSKISKQNDITIRTITTGRNHADLQQMIGYFIRVFGVKNEINPTLEFSTFLKDVNSRFLEVLDNDLYPYELILHEQNAGKTIENSINVDYVYQNIQADMVSDQIKLEGIKVESVAVNAAIAKNDLLLSVSEEADDLHFYFNYNTDLITEANAALLVAQFKTTLLQVVESPTLKIGAIQLNKGTENPLLNYLDLTQNEVENAFEVNTTQRDIYFDCQLNPTAQNQQLISYCCINKELNVEHFSQSINTVAATFETLRSEIVEKGDRIYQVVKKKVQPTFVLLDWSLESLDKEELHKKVLQTVSKDNTIKQPYFEFYLIKLQNNNFVFTLRGHHILFDGISSKLLFEAIDNCYENRVFTFDAKCSLKKNAEVHTTDFDSDETLAYWAEQLKSVEPLEIYGSSRTTQLKTDRTVVSHELLVEIQNYCSKNSIHQSEFFKAIYAYIVKKYTNCESDFLIRELSSGRTIDSKQTIGCFFHSVPRIVKGDAFTKSFSEILNEFSEQRKATIPFSKISVSAQNQLIANHKLAVYYNYSPYFTLDFGDDTLPLYEGETTGKDDLELKIEILPNEVALRLNYNSFLFSGERFLERFLSISSQIVNGKELPNEWDLVLEDERKLVFNQETETEFPADRTIHQLFEEQVKKTPNAIALQFGNEVFTYAQLNSRANGVARKLIELGITTEDIVPIVVDRSIEMVVGLLGIIKAGGAYLPIDPELPNDRISYMMEDSQASILVTLSTLAVPFQKTTLFLDTLQYAEGEAFENLELNVNASNLVYVIYTSGSTGKPKGTKLEHAGVVNRIHWMRNKYTFNENDCVIQKTTYSFDVSVWEFFMTLCYGAKLVLCRKEVIYDADLLIEFIEKYNITTLHFVPSMFNVFLSRVNDENKHKIDSVRQIFTSGEALSLESVKRHHRYLKAALHNLYGPTEASVDVTYYETSEVDTEVPIGKAIDNIQLYVLDQQLNPLPVGVPGELHIAGVGVARGYHNKLELTDEKFIPNPFGAGKLYKTGDLCKFREDGNILYLGRIDHQVKIRGYRIELGEIEEQMRAFSPILDAAVITKEIDGELTICSYFVANSVLNIEDIKTQLSSVLPEYMIPAYIMQIPHIPLSPNGKLDRKALPQPQIESAKIGTLPSTSDERDLAAIWRNCLKVDTIFLESDFFALGGHSLKAALLVAHIEKVFSIKIPLAELFRHRKLSEQIQLLSTLSQTESVQIKPAPSQHFYPLSVAQRRLYFLEQLEDVNTAYHLPAVFELNGNVDLQQLEKAAIRVIEKHASLRTSFHLENHEPIQKIHEKGNFHLERLTHTDAFAEVINTFIRPFDLEQPTQWRMAIASQSENKHILLFDMHHIITDGSSMHILIGDLLRFYKNQDTEALAIQYHDFAYWQSTAEYQQLIEKQEDYWLRTFKYEVPLLDLPTDFQRPSNQKFEGDSISFELNSELKQKLESLAIAQNSTVFMVLLSIYNVLLHKYTGQNDFVVGTPVAGRNHTDLQNQIGMFVNTLPLRNEVAVNQSFNDLLNDITEKSLTAFENQNYPFEQLLEKLDISRQMNRNPLFDTMLILQNTDKQEVSMEGVSVKPIDFENKTAKFDLTLNASEHQEGIHFIFEYSTALFSRATISKMANHFVNLVDSVLSNPNTRIQELRILSSAEHTQITEDFNQSHRDYPNVTVLDLFNQYVQKTPSAIALHSDTLSIRYDELDRFSDAIACYLQTNHATDTVVALCMDRSEKVIAAILGILKAGKAYLPIDKTLPENRIQYILANSGANLVFTDCSLKSEITNVRLDEKWNAILANNASLNVSITPDSLAYIIYTSGSTGMPKGCKISHKNLSNYIQYANETYFSADNGNFGLYTSLSFDLTITSIFGALCRGKQLYIYPNQDVQDILEHSFSENSGIDAVKITPAHIRILQHLSIEKTDVNVAIVGGEALLPQHIEILKKINPNMRIFNEYGPTETTVGCVVKEIEIGETIRIGKPIANTQIYILDEQMQPVAKGVFGEIWIGGSGVGLGYINNDELTAQRFVKNPFTQGFLYKSGDVGRWIDNGDIDYLGRKDDQVKIKGYRIELGEIETHLTTMKLINEAVVVDRTDSSGENYLCAYYTGTADSDTIKSGLNKELPSYMIPSFYIPLDVIPLTSNGKIDKRALPEPVKGNSTVRFKKPVTPVELILADIWKHVLHVDEVGLNDDFFNFGGDSIKAIQLVSRLKSKGYSLQIKDVFENSKLEDLAKKAKKTDCVIDQKEVIGSAPTTAIQKSFLQKNEKLKAHYNQSVMLYSAEGFDEEVVKKAFKTLIAHHDALRIHVNGSEIENAAIDEVQVEVYTCRTSVVSEIESKAQDLQMSFVITEAPLIRLAVFHTDKGSHLLIIIHHLIVDGVSWRILLEDFDLIYQSIINSEKLTIPAKTHSFIDWAKEVNTLANTDRFIKSQAYWFDKGFENIPMPFDKTTGDSGFERVKLAFSLEETQLLIKKVNSVFSTDLNELLLSALTIATAKVSQKQQFTVLMEGHGREAISPSFDVSRTVGWFTSLYPVVLKNEGNIAQTIIYTKEYLRNIPDKGIGYGILKELTHIENKKDFPTIAEPQLVFNFLGDFDSSIHAESFEISPLSTGENTAESEKLYAIELNGLIAEKKLNFDVDFNNSLLNKTQQHVFIDEFKAAIRSIVDAAKSVDKPVLSPSDFGLKDVGIEEFNTVLSQAKGEIEKIYPLSPMQQGMLFHNLMDEDEAYFEQTILTMKGNLDKALFEKTFNQIIARHEILRSNSITGVWLKPHQIIFREKFASVFFENITSKRETEQEQHVQMFMEQEKSVGLDLAHDLLMKVSVFQTADDTFKIIWTHHHIVIDGWCLGIILNDFFTLYNANVFGETAQLKPTQPYSNYIKWIQSQDHESAMQYWSMLLEEVEHITEIPFKKKQKTNDFVQQQVELVLNAKENDLLHTLASQYKVTPYTLLQTIWGIQLQKYNSIDYAVFGSVVSGRPPEIDGVEQMVGLFINTVPVKIGRQTTFRDTVIEIQKQNNNTGQYEFIPLNEISAISSLKSELINHLMIYENYPLEKQAEALNDINQTLAITKVENSERTNYDFTITVLPTETLTISFDFNQNAYEINGVESIKESFHTLLTQVLKNPEIPVKSMNLLCEVEREQLITTTQSVQVNHRKVTVADLFTETALQTPKNVALRYLDKSLTYEQLHAKSNVVAAYLQQKGVTTNDIIGIYATPDFDMMIGLMGILKSGAAYLPIDVNYPSDRIQYMLEDSGAKILLTNTEIPSGLQLDCLVSTLKTIVLEYATSICKPVEWNANDLAYIIYTSGSTGKPKGVMVTQSNFTDYIQTIQQMFTIEATDVMLQHASIAFDTTIEELYPVLCSGGSLLLPNDPKDFEEILYNFEHNDVTLFCTSPLVLNYINQEAKNLGKLRLITVGGDELKAKYVDKIIDKVDVWNGYGPTESTVCATYYQVKGNEDLMPIGKPFINRSAYILNHDENVLPYGLSGELCVGGNGVTLGYLNRPELTDEKFISSSLEDSKIYKTGDLCSWDENGNILFFGRIDSQVKIRGFRIELGEIEAQLLKHSGVNEAIVLAWDDENNSKFLAAYLTGNTNQQEVKKFLEKELPEYMIPAYFVFLDKMPLTINGKTDRKALKRPDLKAMVVDDYVAPENEIQEVLARVWSEILGVKVGIDTNFFTLGGDSIKAIQMVSRIQKYNLKTEVKEVFKNPTIRQLALMVRSLTLTVNQDEVVGNVPLIPIQKAFLEENLPLPHHYNQSVVLYSRKRIERESLEVALTRLIGHHDALRSVFVNGSLVIRSLAEIKLNIELVETDDKEEIDAHIQQTQESFDLENGILFKAVLYRMFDGDHLFLVAHHMVIDGLSWRIILEDIQTLLLGDTTLPFKTHSTQIWGEQLEQYASSMQLKQELALWKDIEAQAVIEDDAFVNLYVDNTRTSVEFSEEQTTDLLKNVNEAYNTEINDILLSALVNALSLFNKHEKQVVFLEGHGREELFENIDISRTVGWFTSMYPVALTSEGDVSLLIKNTKETLRKIPSKGIGYGILRYLNSDSGLTLKPQISFNYLGQFDDTFKDSEFGISSISSGFDVSLKNTKETLIDVSGMVVNGRLKMDFMFNPNIRERFEVDQLKERFKDELLMIIAHCIEKDTIEKTVSDFGSKDLSEEELGDIMDMFDDL
jgi:amino acid adenylation domain-containing protein/non-ribosomal peptide synthase protein (TIGR01720 family)